MRSDFQRDFSRETDGDYDLERESGVAISESINFSCRQSQQKREECIHDANNNKNNHNIMNDANVG
jgi:hypothetical protein